MGTQSYQRGIILRITKKKIILWPPHTWGGGGLLRIGTILAGRKQLGKGEVQGRVLSAAFHWEEDLETQTCGSTNVASEQNTFLAHTSEYFARRGSYLDNNIWKTGAT